MKRKIKRLKGRQVELTVVGPDGLSVSAQATKVNRTEHIGDGKIGEPGNVRPAFAMWTRIAANIGKVCDDQFFDLPKETEVRLALREADGSFERLYVEWVGVEQHDDGFWLIADVVSPFLTA